MTQIVLRVNTNRASVQLRTKLGYRPQYYFTVEDSGRYVVLPAEVADEVLPIRGITRSRTKREKLAECW